jgi:class 3 adenylate cyclase/CHASE2 domain-containing sensor protein
VAATPHREPGLTPQRAVAVWVVLALSAVAAHFAPRVERLDLGLLDAQFALLRTFRPAATQAEVVVVGIDEATLAAFPEPIALWHERLAAVFEGIAAGRPRAVGVDIELPERSYDFVRPGLDAALGRALIGLRAAAPVVLALNADASGRIKPIHAPFAAIAGADGLGVATWLADADGTVRRFDEQQAAGDRAVPTLAGVLARRLGAHVEAGIVDFTRGPAFTYVPAHEVAAWATAGDTARLAAAFAGRIVLVGSVLPYVDRHQLPVALAAWEGADGTEARLTSPGVLVHAQALRTLLDGALIRTVPAAIPVGLAVAASLLWFGFVRLRTGLVAAALAIVALAVLSTMLLQRGVHVPIAAALLAAVVASSARVAYEAWFNARQRAFLRRAFAGAVSPGVLDLILRGELESQLGSGRRPIAVMFGDIRDFTPLTERSDPEHVVRLLNRYFARITAAAHRHGGTVDNFRGDGIMCIFGAPQPLENACLAGFLAARAMFDEVEALNAELAAEGIAPIRIGLSLAYGEAVVGRIGGPERNEYTAIGDVANVSARIEGLTKEVGYPLVVTDEVERRVGTAATFDDLGERALKGHSPVRICGWPARATHLTAEDRAA